MLALRPIQPNYLSVEIISAYQVLLICHVRQIHRPFWLATTASGSTLLRENGNLIINQHLKSVASAHIISTRIG
jgi:hypothetical protein